MVDWSGHEGTPTAQRYRSMAERQLRGVSPSYEAICLGVADDADLIALLDTLPAPKRQPNLLLAAVRFLAGPVDSFAAFRSWLLGCWDEVAATMLERRTQTNEARRCATLLPVLAGIQQPLALLEVGASAGLCLYPDRYAYRYNGGPVIGESPVVLDCRCSGPAPIPDARPEVAWRAGLDLNPLDVNDDEDVRWLESLIWPEERERFEILRAAVALAREDPVPVRRGDLLTDLAAVAGEAPEDATLVVFHSAVLAYLTQDQRARFRAAVGGLAAGRPTVWVSNEGPGVVVDLPPAPGALPFVLARVGGTPSSKGVAAGEEVALATTSPHGEWLDWLAR